MPQVARNFSAYPISATLDGNGDGAVRFQAVGSNVRITNLSVRVSSAAAQATATVYKNIVGPDYRLSGTNSGSTGDSLSVPVDLFDGESVIVEWKGGDAGATATATFSGKQLPFDEVGTGEGGANWSSPIAAGDGSLVYPAVKSSNYSAGSTGWQLNRDGNADLNNVDIRGDLTVTGSGAQSIHVYNSLGIGAPTVEFNPDYVGAEPGNINAQEISGSGYLSIEAPAIPPRIAGARILLSTNPTDDEVQILSSQVGFSADLVMSDGNVNVLDADKSYLYSGSDTIKRWYAGTSATASSAAITGAGVETVVLTIPLRNYRANKAYIVEYMSWFLVSVAPNRPIWNLRKTNNTGQLLRTVNLPAVNATQHTAQWSGKFVVGSSNVSAVLVITLATNSVGYSVTQIASVGNPASADVYCIGDASNHPDAVELV